MEIFILIVLGLCLIGSGILAVSSNTKSLTSRYYLFFTFFVVLWTFSNYFSNVLKDYLFVLLFNRLIFTSTTFMIWFLYLFAVYYPRPYVQTNKKRSILGWISSLFIGLLGLTSFIVDTVTIEKNYSSIDFGFAVYLYALHFLLYFGASIFILVRKYKNFIGLEKLKVQYLFLGVFLSLAGAITTNLILPVVSDNFSLSNFGPLFFILFALFSTYSIIRHRLFGISFFIGKTLYFLMMALVSFISFHLAYLLVLSIWQSVYSIEAQIMGFVFAVVYVFIFFHINNFVETHIYRRIIFSGKDFRKSKRNLEKSISTELDKKKITQSYLTTIIDTIVPSFVAVVLIDGGMHNKDKVYSNVPNMTFSHLKEKYELITTYWKKKGHVEPILFDELRDIDSTVSKSGIQKVQAQVIACMEKEQIFAIFPLDKTMNIKGCLLLGQKKYKFSYTLQDVSYITSLIEIFFIALERAQLFEEISNFNITLREEVRKATENLRKANIRLKELDKQKDEFVSIASHELRTPLTAIKGYLWMAMQRFKKESDPVVHHQLDVSYKSTERLIHLVNDMLTISRIDGKRIELICKQMYVPDILHAVYDELKIQSEEKQLEFTLDVDKNIPRIQADSEKLRDVFQNLVGNALKFTLDGFVHIICRVDSHNIVVEVSDTGPGIREQDRDRLFEKFSKIDYAYAKQKNIQGTGLGLYITKKIVTLHGGTIEVQSKVDKGSTFIVRLPIKPKKGNN